MLKRTDKAILTGLERLTRDPYFIPVRKWLEESISDLADLIDDSEGDMLRQRGARSVLREFLKTTDGARGELERIQQQSRSEPLSGQASNAKREPIAVAPEGSQKWL